MRQVDMVEEDVAWVGLATAMVTKSVTPGFFADARVVVPAIGGGSSTERHPGHFNLARVAVAVTRIELVEHRFRLVGVPTELVAAIRHGYQQLRSSATGVTKESERFGWKRFAIRSGAVRGPYVYRLSFVCDGD
jgi:hypothetical protein